MRLTQVLSRHARAWWPLMLPTVAALWGTGWGCGGVVTDSRAQRDAGNNPNPPDGLAGNPGTGGSPIKKSRCGDGVLAPTEMCDGAQFKVGMRSCTEASMGVYPYGSVNCTSACTVDLSGCYAGGDGGAPGTGGRPNGGTFGGGGMGGSFGFPGTSQTVCYQSGGVPDPSFPSTCLFGADAQNACFNQPSSDACADKCGCSFCASLYDQCRKDGACFWIWSCAQGNRCYSTSACYQAGCSSMIDSGGGLGTPSANLADRLIQCFQSNNCTLTCNG